MLNNHFCYLKLYLNIIEKLSKTAKINFVITN